MSQGAWFTQMPRRRHASVYRARDRGVRPAFAVPGYPVTPAVFVLVSLYIAISAVTSSPRNSAISAGLIALGRPVLVVDSTDVDADGRPLVTKRSRFAAERVEFLVENG